MKKKWILILSLAIILSLEMLPLRAEAMDKSIFCSEDINSDEFNTVLRTVTATVISPYGYFYSESSLSDDSLLFSIPRGNTVEVLDSNVDDNVAKVKYAGYTGYIRKKELKF